MTFEEDFPSLKGCGKLSYRDSEDYTVEAIFQSGVEKHCLDKQKVQDEFENLMRKMKNKLIAKQSVRAVIYKHILDSKQELGLK